MEIPVIKVGILKAKKIDFTLNCSFKDLQGNIYDSGEWTVEAIENGICLTCGEIKFDALTDLILSPIQANGDFTLLDVCIGIGFHWERKEAQTFKSKLQFLLDDGHLWAINHLSIEDYLCSVISSEMSATSSLELLKAHAVISRSWLVAQLDKTNLIQQSQNKYCSETRTENELIKWYDREDHQHFDVCADDHCQRYQGITKATSELVKQAVKASEGLFLMYNDHICDARFSKCCGGISELFESVWEPKLHPYLEAFTDAANREISINLKDENQATKWMLEKTDTFCNTNDKRILSQVLNNYDQETNDFYRWIVTYSQTELSELIRRKMNIDFGEIQALIPIERGPSGRILKLEIVGSNKTLTIGKELEIRKALSQSHLYSSAFIVEKTVQNHQIIFTLKGAGWGHGVGLCQIGAAVMGELGYVYTEILSHYFKPARLLKLY